MLNNMPDLAEYDGEDLALLFEMNLKVQQITEWIEELAQTLDDIEAHGYTPGDPSERGQQLQATMLKLLERQGYR